MHAYLRAKRCLSCARLGPALFDPVEQTAQLVAAYGQNIFLDGVFGADPHPGNLLLLPDNPNPTTLTLQPYNPNPATITLTR